MMNSLVTKHTCMTWFGAGLPAVFSNFPSVILVQKKLVRAAPSAQVQSKLYIINCLAFETMEYHHLWHDFYQKDENFAIQKRSGEVGFGSGFRFGSGFVRYENFIKDLYLGWFLFVYSLLASSRGVWLFSGSINSACTAWLSNCKMSDDSEAGEDVESDNNGSFAQNDVVIRRSCCRYGSGCTHIFDPSHRDRFWHPSAPKLNSTKSF